MIRLKLGSGVEINATKNHEFLFNGEWVEIGKLARRAMERGNWKQRNIFYKQQRTLENYELEEFWYRKDNEPCSKGMHNKRHNIKTKLEACCLNIDKIVEIEFYISKEKVYDLCVEDNHNYIITKENIIVHNSKSFTGCLWILTSCIKYPETRWFIARARLKSLKESTLLTFFEVCRMLGFKLNTHYTYNSVSGIIHFINGSEVFLKDLFLYPSDPEFVALGSTEYTGGFIDEMGEISFQGYNIIKSRIRYKLDLYGLIPKIFMGSNPCKTFVYHEFYKKWKENTLEKYKAYIPATVYDNPYISPHYIENLKRLDPKNRERLLYGNWDYDDDPSALYERDALSDLFTNSGEPGEKFMTVDVARFGKDKTVIYCWNGTIIYKIIVMLKSSTQEVRKEIEYQCKAEKIRRSHTIVDEDGVGGGVVDETEGIHGFVNNSTPISDLTKISPTGDDIKPNYANLKTQCYFELAPFINSGKLAISAAENIQEVKYLNGERMVSLYSYSDFRTELIEELEQVKRKDIDKDKKLSLIDKKEIKDNIQRSPDWSDALMEIMYFTLSGETGWLWLDMENEQNKEDIDSNIDNEAPKEEYIETDEELEEILD